MRESSGRGGRERELDVQFIENGEGARESPVGFKAAINTVHEERD
jgi:hypothetical protein